MKRFHNIIVSSKIMNFGKDKILNIETSVHNYKQSLNDYIKPVCASSSRVSMTLLQTRIPNAPVLNNKQRDPNNLQLWSEMSFNPKRLLRFSSRYLELDNVRAR